MLAETFSDSTVDDPDRDLPVQQLEAEKTVLGACLTSATNEATPLLLQRLDAEHFWRPAHQAIYAAIQEMFGDGQHIDTITLAAALERRRELVKVGGAPYLHELLACVPIYTPDAHLGWCKLVAKAHAKRTVTAVGEGLVAATQSGNADIEALLDHAQERLSDVQANVERSAGPGTAVGGMLETVLDEIHQVQEHGPAKGVATGYADLDRVTGGLHPGDLVLVAGRPGIGKSVLTIDVARQAAIRNGTGTIVFSLEMSRSELVKRILSAEGRVRADALGREGGMSSDDWARINTRLPQIEAAPLHIVDTPNMTITAIKAKAREIAATQEIGLIVIDYLQLIESSGRAESRQIEVSAISRKLKLLAKELEVPVVVAAQLNRGPEQRSDKKPQLSDLRESGALEADADKAILIHRPDLYERDDPRMGEADFILAKHRGGPTATITVAHQLHFSRFVDMANETDDEPPRAVNAAHGQRSASGTVVPLRSTQTADERADGDWPEL